MKKLRKFVFFVIGMGIIGLILDLVFIFKFNRPLFAIQKEGENLYKGLFYDTYYCLEYSVPQIKSKGSKFQCSTGKKRIKRVVEIVDTTKEIKDFSCAESLEEFYEDANYKYYYSCIKSKYVIVRYDDGTEEMVESALNNLRIGIEDLDLFDISYIKYEK